MSKPQETKAARRKIAFRSAIPIRNGGRPLAERPVQLRHSNTPRPMREWIDCPQDKAEMKAWLAKGKEKV